MNCGYAVIVQELKKKCWERNEHGDEPIHSKRALHGMEDYLTWSLRWSTEEEESVKNVKG